MSPRAAFWVISIVLLSLIGALALVWPPMLMTYIVLGPRKIVLFVHGCFWHRHRGCPMASTPTGNTARKSFSRWWRSGPAANGGCAASYRPTSRLYAWPSM